MTSSEESGASQGGLDVVLHPLVVISVSDQYTRARLTSTPKGEHTRILGILLGNPASGNVEITNSFDIVAEFDPETGKIVKIDEEFLENRQKSFAEVFPTAKVVGWYQSGNTVYPDDAIIIAKELSKYTETMIVMMLDSEAAYAEGASDIPISFFETELKGETPGEMSVSFKKSSYHLVTVEAERIGVDHIAKTSTAEGSSQLVVHIAGIQGAMKMLYSRIQIICEYLKNVEAGKTPFDPEIMRKIGVLRDLIPVAMSPDFEKRFFVEYNDVMLLSYLSILTEGLQHLNVMVDGHVVSKPRYEMPDLRDRGDKDGHAKFYYP